MSRIAPLVSAALLAGCVSTYVPNALPPPAANAKLQRAQPVLIATPENGKFEAQMYPKSGAQTAAAIKAAFIRFAGTAEVSAACKTLECLRAEAQGRFSYLVVPEILHWEDRNTEWSGKPDVVSVRITVYGAASLEPIETVKIEQTAAWAIMGGMHPELLLPQPIHDFTASLY